MPSTSDQHPSDGSTGARIEFRSPRVLLAEDDDDQRALLTSVLRRKGYRVVPVRDGVELIDRIQSGTWSAPDGTFDAIVADINMPGLTAFEVLAAVQCSGFSTPVILITAAELDETSANEVGLSPAALFRKPLDLDVLDCTLRRLVRPH